MRKVFMLHLSNASVLAYAETSTSTEKLCLFLHDKCKKR